MELKLNHKALDMEIKKLRRANLRAIAASEPVEKATMSLDEAAIRYHRNQILEHKSFDNPHLSSSRFLIHMESRQLQWANIAPSSIEFSPSFEVLVCRNIIKSHKNRARGPNGLILELFNSPRT